MLLLFPWVLPVSTSVCAPAAAASEQRYPCAIILTVLLEPALIAEAAHGHAGAVVGIRARRVAPIFLPNEAHVPGCGRSFELEYLGTISTAEPLDYRAAVAVTGR